MYTNFQWHVPHVLSKAYVAFDNTFRKFSCRGTIPVLYSMLVYNFAAGFSVRIKGSYCNYCSLTGNRYEHRKSVAPNSLQVHDMIIFNAFLSVLHTLSRISKLIEIKGAGVRISYGI
jgi:hypothetical protein